MNTIRTSVNPHDQARWALINKLPASMERPVFATTHANISITRRCQSSCPHCAPDARPDATEKLARDQISKFLLGLTSFPIQALHIEGGEPLLEPELLYHAFQRSLFNQVGVDFIIESNLSWCDNEQRIEETLRHLSHLHSRFKERGIIIAGNIDQYHAGASPFENVIRLIKHFYRYFPFNSINLSRTWSPNDNSLVVFADLLARNKLLAGIEKTDWRTGNVITEYLINMAGKKRRILVDNKYPILVGRARALRTPEYLAWRKKQKKPFPCPHLHENESLLYRNRPVPEIFSLGWNGQLYHDAMFMHTTTYPIGDIDQDSPDEAFERANKDPLIRRLIQRGFGAVYRMAKQVVPGLEEKYEEAKADGLLTIEFALDTLADPETNLHIIERIIEEERSGHIPKSSNHRAARSLAEAKPTLLKLMGHDWTGMEHSYLDAAIKIIEKLDPIELAKAVTMLKDKKETRLLTLSLLKSLSSYKKRKKFIELVASNKELLGYFAPTQALIAALVLKDEAEIPKAIEQLSDPQAAKETCIILDDFIALNLGPLIEVFFAMLTNEQLSRLLFSVLKNDYDNALVASDLLQLVLKIGKDVNQIITLIDHPEAQAMLSDLLLLPAKPEK